jgi:hypothetical protein
VCLDCTKQFTYDLKEMRIGKMIDRSHDACVLPPGMPRPRKTKLAYALGVAVPLAVLVGAGMRAKKQERDKRRSKVELALNQDYSINSQQTPAAAGSAIMIYSTGLGLTDPPFSTGQGGGSSPPNVTVEQPPCGQEPIPPYPSLDRSPGTEF